MAQQIGFGRTAAERIKAAVIRSEGAPYPKQPPGSKYPIISGTPIGYAEGIVTTAITAFNANTNTYGKGAVQPYQPSLSNGNTNTYLSVADTSYNGNGSVLCLNFSVNSGTVNTNTHVGMIQRQTANGSFVFQLLWRDC